MIYQIQRSMSKEEGGKIPFSQNERKNFSMLHFERDTRAPSILRRERGRLARLRREPSGLRQDLWHKNCLTSLREEKQHMERNQGLADLTVRRAYA
jgi:hypothetical protein